MLIAPVQDHLGEPIGFVHFADLMLGTYIASVRL
jgi:hypothetical protein